jgi:hypothetical protein
MDANALAWLPYAIGAGVLLAFPPGRKLLGLIIGISLAIIGLLILSEPDLRD